MDPHHFGYHYDNIGNRTGSGVDSNTTDYTANDLNQYDDIDPPGSATKEYLCYDEDGNLIRDGKSSATCPGTDGLFKYAWDAENRLIAIEPTGTPESGDKRLEFEYEYMGTDKCCTEFIQYPRPGAR